MNSVIDCEDVGVEMVRLWPGLIMTVRISRDLVGLPLDSSVVVVEKVGVDHVAQLARDWEVWQCCIDVHGREIRRESIYRHAGWVCAVDGDGVDRVRGRPVGHAEGGTRVKVGVLKPQCAGLAKRQRREVGDKWWAGKLRDSCLLCVVQTETTAKAAATSATASPELAACE
jgi:hypothetical protein